jgi:hypothetical protein
MLVCKSLLLLVLSVKFIFLSLVKNKFTNWERATIEFPKIWQIQSWKEAVLTTDN